MKWRKSDVHFLRLFLFCMIFLLDFCVPQCYTLLVFLVLFLNFYLMRKIFSFWKPKLRADFFHWLKADEVYLKQYQNTPDLFYKETLEGVERWAIFRSMALICLIFFVSWGLQLVWIEFFQQANPFFFLGQALLLGGAFSVAIGAIGIAGRTSQAFVCWSVMAADVFLMALLFEQMYEVALLGHLVIVPLILGGAVGMVLGGALVLFWVKNTNRFLRHLGFSSRKIGF